MKAVEVVLLPAKRPDPKKRPDPVAPHNPVAVTQGDGTSRLGDVARGSSGERCYFRVMIAGEKHFFDSREEYEQFCEHCERGEHSDSDDE